MALDPDARKREFRRYLEREGVMEALTKALISLYEKADRPADPLAYVLVEICSKDMVPSTDLEALQNQVADSFHEVQELSNKCSEMRKKIEEIQRAK